MRWKKDRGPEKKSRSKIVIYSHMHKALHSFMFAMAGQTAESNLLNFSKETHGHPTLVDDIS